MNRYSKLRPKRKKKKKAMKQLHNGRPKSDLAMVSRNCRAWLHEEEDGIVNLH